MGNGAFTCPGEGLLIFSQSKHIVIFDTLIKQSKAEEVEAVLGENNFSRFPDQFSYPSSS